MAYENKYQNNEKEISSQIYSMTNFLGKKGESSPLNSIFTISAKGYDTMFFTVRNQEDTTKFSKSSTYAIAVDDLGIIETFLESASVVIKNSLLATDFKNLYETKVLVDKKIMLKKGYSLGVTSTINVNGDSKSRATYITLSKIDESGEPSNVSTIYLPTKMIGFFGSAQDITILNNLSLLLLSVALGTNLRYHSHRERQYKAFREEGHTPTNQTIPENTPSDDINYDDDEFPF